MPILTKEPVSKGSASAFVLDKAELALLISDPYWNQISNWKSVTLFFKSNSSNQNSSVTFNMNSNSSNFKVSGNAKGDFEIESISIKDFDNDHFVITRNPTPVSGLVMDNTLKSQIDIPLAVLSANFTRNFVADNSFGTGEFSYGSETFDTSGLVISDGGGYDGLVGQFATSLPLNKVYNVRFYIQAYSGDLVLDTYADDPMPLITEMSSSELTNAIGGYIERKLIIRSSGSYFGIFAEGAGSVTISKIEFFETSESVPQKLNAPSNVTVSTQVDGSHTIFWFAPNPEVTDLVVTYDVSYRVLTVSNNFSVLATGLTAPYYEDTNTYAGDTYIEYRITARTSPAGLWQGQSYSADMGHLVMIPGPGNTFFPYSRDFVADSLPLAEETLYMYGSGSVAFSPQGLTFNSPDNMSGPTYEHPLNGQIQELTTYQVVIEFESQALTQGPHDPDAFSLYAKIGTSDIEINRSLVATDGTHTDTLTFSNLGSASAFSLYIISNGGLENERKITIKNYTITAL